MSWWERNFKKALQGAVNFLNNVDIDGTLNVDGVELKDGGITTTANINMGGNLIAADTFKIAPNTVDTNDNKEAYFCGGGAATTNQGAFIRVAGNEHTNTGQAWIYAGNHASAHLNGYTTNNAAEHRRWLASLANPHERFVRNASAAPEQRIGNATLYGHGAFVSSGSYSSSGVPINLTGSYGVLHRIWVAARTTFVGHCYVSCSTTGTNYYTRVLAFTVRCDAAGSTPAVAVTVIHTDPGSGTTVDVIIGGGKSGGSSYFQVTARDTSASNSYQATSAVVGAIIEAA